MSERKTHIDVGAGDRSSHQKGGEEEVEDQRRGPEWRDILCTKILQRKGAAN